MTAANAVHATALERDFGGGRGVRGVDLSLNRGDCLAVFGPNGAGKTTLLRLVAGLLKPTRGSVSVDGVDIRRDHAARAAVGLVSHHTMLYPVLTALENVEFSAQLHGFGVDAARKALDTLKAGDLADVQVRKLSRGQQQRVSIARALVHAPTVLLLDEPYSGLDESGAAALTKTLTALRAGGATLVLVTHNIAEGLAIASHAAIMIDGRLTHSEARPGGGFNITAFAARYRQVAGVDRG